MVFGFHKQERRVPDLSRYDYYYQNQPDYNRSRRLSAAAASAASGLGVPSGVRAPAGTGQRRTQSMVYSSGAAQNAKRSARRSVAGGAAAAATRGRQATGNVPGRTYSLASRAKPKQQQRTQSLTTRPQGTPKVGSRTNSMTTKITQVRDPQGRTKSITRTTVKRIDGYDYIETTTTTTDVVPARQQHDARIESEKHFDEFSANFVSDDNDELVQPAAADDLLQHQHQEMYDNLYLDDVAEEEEGTETPVLSHSGVIPLDEESSVSQFSDAVDYIPQRRRTAAPAQRAKQPQVHRRKKKVVQPAAQPAQQQRKTLTDQEMYLKALEVAKRKVYQNGNDPAAASLTGHPGDKKSTMGARMSLRNSSMNTQHTQEKTMPRSSSMILPKQKSHNKFGSNFFSRNNKQQKQEQQQPQQPQQSRAPLGGSPSSNSLDTASLPPQATDLQRHRERAKEITIQSKNKLTDEQMYAQALEIAQKRYSDAHKVDAQQAPRIAQSATSVTTPPLPAVAEQNPDTSLKRLADVKETQSNLLRAQTGETPAETAPEDLDHIVSETPVSSSAEADATANAVPTEQPQREDDGSLVGPTAIPEVPYNEAFVAHTAKPDLEPPKRNILRRVHTSHSDSGNNKSAFKNFMDKVVQFSNENSGYQPAKEEKMRLEEERRIQEQEENERAQQLHEQQLHPPPLQKVPTGTTTHGATTTLPVEQPLGHPVFADLPSETDAASATSFTRRKSEGRSSLVQATPASSSIFSKPKKNSKGSSSQSDVNHTLGGPTAAADELPEAPFNVVTGTEIKKQATATSGKTAEKKVKSNFFTKLFKRSKQTS